MPSTSVQCYATPEQFESAFISAAVEVTPIGRSPFAARVARLELDRMWVVATDELAPRIKWAAQSLDRTFIRLLSRPGSDYIIDGAALRLGEIIHLGHGHSYYEHTDGPVHWAGLSLPVDDMAAAEMAITGREPMALREPTRVTPTRPAMTRLRRLHAEAIALAEAAPCAELPAEAAHSLEQSLVEATIACLSNRDARKSSWARQCHATVMRRFHRLMEEMPHRALYLPEVCAAIGVPERTLRLCCQEQLGISPKHYLLLRRVHLAHRALLASGPGETTVTEVATRFGFWHFGRFAGFYRMVFGEAPSATLSNPAVHTAGRCRASAAIS